MSDLFSKSKTGGLRRVIQEAIKASPTLAAQASPVVKTIQAGYNILRIGEAIKKADDAAGNLNQFVPEASKLIQGAQGFVPSMQVMGKSLCDSVKLFNQFNLIANTVGIASNIVLTYQGVQALNLIATRLKDISDSLAAQTALRAQKDFPELVYYMIRERLSQTSQDPDLDHWFYVFHPDNDWYPKFFHLIESKPLDPRFCGYTNQIDTAFVFMLATRKMIEEKNARSRRHGKPFRPVRLHLLIPAYQPILIPEALEIPKDIGDFVMEGRIHSTRELVWFNLPTEQSHYTMDIGHWVPPEPSWWDRAMLQLGLKDTLPGRGRRRILGTRQRGLEDENVLADVKDNGDREVEADDALSKTEGQDDEKTRNQATPLQHRRRRRRDSRHR